MCGRLIHKIYCASFVAGGVEVTMGKSRKVAYGNYTFKQLSEMTPDKFKEFVDNERIPLGDLTSLRKLFNVTYDQLNKIKTDLIPVANSNKEPDKSDKATSVIKDCFKLMMSLEVKCIILRDKEERLKLEI